MKLTTAFACVFSLCVSAQADASLVLVYSGKGSCKDHCAEAAANIAKMAGLETRFVTPSDLTPELLNEAALWIQPGGNAIIAAKALGRKRLEMIREFVRNGGAYVGFCAGAFLVDSTVDDDGRVPGLGIIPWTTAYYPVDSGKDGILLDLNWQGVKRTLYFNGGGTFRLTDEHPVTVLATYENGDPAALDTYFEKGRVVVAGAHPEALDSWKTDAFLVDPDGRDHDLALDMVQRALSGESPLRRR